MEVIEGLPSIGERKKKLEMKQHHRPTPSKYHCNTLSAQLRRTADNGDDVSFAWFF